MSQNTTGRGNHPLKRERRCARGLVRGSGARRLRLEPLEGRLLLSAGADGERLDVLRATYYGDRQMLEILGTEQPEVAAVWADADGLVLVESPLGNPIQIHDPLGNPMELALDEVDSLVVHLFGGDDWLAVGYWPASDESATVMGVEPSPFTVADIAVDAGEGNDVVEVRAFAEDFQVDSFFDISFDIDLGEGDNLLALDGKGNDVAVKVQAGSGADEAIVRVKPVPASPAGMSPNKLTAAIDLGGGDDVVEVHAFEEDFQVDSFFDISFDIDLGEGDNLLALDGKGNDVAVQVQAGSGADKAIVRVKPVPASPAGMSPNKLTAAIDLGGGDDVVEVQAFEGDFQVDSFFDISFDINLGEGENLLSLDGKGNDVALQVQAGSGADEVIVRVKPVPASPAGMSPNKLTAAIDLGGGDDVVEVHAFEGDFRVDSFFDISFDINLGEGDNLLALDGKGNDVAVKVQAGSGADLVSMEVSASNSVNSTIAAGGGSDVINVSYSALASRVDSLSLAAIAGEETPSSVQVVAGGGDDQVTLQLAGVLDRAMHVGVLGQGGRDQLRVEASQLNISRDGALLVGISGGRSDDTIEFFNRAADDDSLPPRVEGRLRLRLAGGTGNDTIEALLACHVFDTGHVSAKVIGGVGDDLLTLLAEDVLGRFVIDGGRGRDDYLASDNVLVRNCEGLIEDAEELP